MTSYNFCKKPFNSSHDPSFSPLHKVFIHLCISYFPPISRACLYLSVRLSSCMSVHLIPYTIIIVAYRFPIISSFFPFLCIPPYIHHYRSHRDQDMRKISRDSYQGPDVSRNWTPESRPMTTIDGVSLKRGNP